MGYDMVRWDEKTYQSLLCDEWASLRCKQCMHLYKSSYDCLLTFITIMTRRERGKEKKGKYIDLI